MITKFEALNNSTFYHKIARNRDGTPVRCRKNGVCKTWKTRLEDFRLPVKYGLKKCFYITPVNAHEWCISEEEALDASNTDSKQGASEAQADRSFGD